MKPRNFPELKPLFKERMQKLLSKEDYKKYLEILKIPPVKSIRCNTLKISPEKLKKRLETKNWKIKQPFRDYPEIMIVEGKTDENKINLKNSDNLLIDKGGITREGNLGGQAKLSELEPGELGRALEHLLGYYYIQEIASMLPVLTLNPLENEKVLDLCASPGSKTTQIASKIKNKGLIIANEISLGRIKILASNTERCGVTNAIITKKDGVILCKKLRKEERFFDKILLDAPCSGEGTLRSSYKTYKMWNINTIKQMSKLQKNLFEAAFETLKPQGEIVYSTCTHAPEENEEIINFVLEKFKDSIKIEKINLPIKTRQGILKWQEKEYLDDVKFACRIYPQDNNTEGFFIAKFKKIK